jgi:putative ATPase
MAPKPGNSLFAAESADEGESPLAYRMRPRVLSEYIGQDHIVGPGRLLRRSIQADQLSSIILYGPPGTGKTTLARVIANTTKSRFMAMNAVLTGVADLRLVIDQAKQNKELYARRTILFIDEVHRWNKAQQDALLPWVENGTVVLIGATTENPFFEVNRALVSRSRIFQLKPLTEEELFRVARQAMADPERGYGRFRVSFEEEALEHLVRTANGDARSLLNALELAVETSPESFPPPDGSEIRISREAAEESIQKKVVLYDRDGDYHYDTVSAFIKSLRGSDPDAALYWLARMVRAGEDPSFIFRRMLISAGEDVGLADPRAISVVESCAAAFDRIGMPEGNFHLTLAALYLATAPKSNSALGFFDAVKSVEEESAEVPSHLKDSSRDAEGFGHGEGYKYPHEYEGHWVAQNYLPESLKGSVFYQPGTEGYEGSVASDVERRRALQLAIAEEERSPELLSWSSGAEAKASGARGAYWAGRSDPGRRARREAIAAEAASRASIERHSLVLVLNAASGDALFEALKRAPEGGTTGLASSAGEIERLGFSLSRLPEVERPLLVAAESLASYAASYRGPRFDRVLGIDSGAGVEKTGFFAALASLLESGGRFSIAETVPSKGTRLSGKLPRPSLPDEVFAAFEAAEETIYADRGLDLLAWDEKALAEAAARSGLEAGIAELRPYEYPRLLSSREMDAWLSPDSFYGSRLKALLGDDRFGAVSAALRSALPGRELRWTSVVAFVSGAKPL